MEWMKVHFRKSQMILMCSQVWEPLIKELALRNLMRVKYRTTEESGEQVISTLGWAGFIMQKSRIVKLRTGAQISELTQKVFWFPFFFDEYDSYDGASYKEKRTRKRELRLPSIKWSPFAHAFGLALLHSGTWNFLTSHSCSQELSPFWFWVIPPRKGRLLSESSWGLPTRLGALCVEYLLCNRQSTRYVWHVHSLRWVLLLPFENRRHWG